MSNQEQTAKEVWDYLTSRGWTKESVAGVLGNMQSESGIIADRWQSDKVGNMDGGYGLVQWTPATKYIDWAKGRGLVYQAVSSQCERLIWEVANQKQFDHPSMSFKQFTQSTQSPEALADIFLKYYERPANKNQPARQTQARYWYNKFKDTINLGKKERAMECFYAIDGQATVYYFDGQTVTELTHRDERNALNQIYKANYGVDMPEMKWVSKAPFYVRLGSVLDREPVYGKK